MLKQKKNLVSLYILLLSCFTMIHILIPKIDGTIHHPVAVIPEEAIRLRILANSDRKEDQLLKEEIRDAVNEVITEWVEDLTSIDEARNVIKNRLREIQQIGEEIIARHQVDQQVQVEFATNVLFPTKLYGEFLYPAGEYEAILITLGKGEGSNWWCVLFPPLCFLDFSNGVAVSDGFEEEEDGEESSPYFVEEKEEPVKIKFFIFELFKKIFT